MGKRIIVDPITRIEGHLRIEVEVENGKVVDAWCSGQMFRGIEIMLQGRDPRDAHPFVQRSCGVCTYVHALSSVRAVEKACNIEVPENARIIRNLLHGSQFQHDHIVHFITFMPWTGWILSAPCPQIRPRLQNCPTCADQIPLDRTILEMHRLRQF